MNQKPRWSKTEGGVDLIERKISYISVHRVSGDTDNFCCGLPFKPVLITFPGQRSAGLLGNHYKRPGFPKLGISFPYGMQSLHVQASLGPFHITL